MTTQNDHIGITGEPQTDPDICKFTVDRPVYPDGSIRCNDPEMAKDSPLLESLFAIEGIAQVLVYGSTVMLAKKSDAEWPMVGREVGAAIRTAILSGEPLISEELAKRQPTDTELQGKVEALFNEHINPYVAQHGGHVEIVDVKDKTVFVSFSGGCQGCSASSVTLKDGIEKLVFEEIPEIAKVVDITDHSSGENPYYQ